MEMERLNLLLVRDLDRLIEDFCEDCGLKNMTNESIRRYRSCLEIFAIFLASRGLSIKDVDKWVLKDFLHYIRYDRKVKQKTVENYFSAISSFYEYLVFEELLRVNVVLPFRKRFLRSYQKLFW